MQYLYTKQAEQAIDYALRTAHEFHQEVLSSEYILAGLLCVPEGVAGSVLGKVPVELEDLLRLINELAIPDISAGMPDTRRLTPEAKRMMDHAKELSVTYRSERIGTEHILLSMLESAGCSAYRILHALIQDSGSLYLDVLTAIGEAENLSKEEKKAIRSGEIRREQKEGILEQFSTDLTKRAADGELDPLIGREEELMRLIQILCRRGKNNPCLIGEPGVGKTAIVEGLAARMAEGMVPEQMSGKRILTLDLSLMVAGTKYRGEFEERIKGVIAEVVKRGNIILFVDEIHTMIGAGGAEGALDASNILKPALSRGQIQMIGATTIDEYRKHIEKDAALERRFAPIMVEEPTEEQTVEILNGLRLTYEQHHKVEILPDGIEAAAHLSARYISDRFLPDKAIDLMDEAAAKVHLRGFKKPEAFDSIRVQMEECDVDLETALMEGRYEDAAQIRSRKERLAEDLQTTRDRFEESIKSRKLFVGENEIADTVSVWTKIPLKQLTEKESQRLVRMESILHKRVIAQEEAVKAVSRAVRRGRVGLKDPHRPTGSFLFLGPTGVGKTEVSKALAEAVFGTEDALIRVDMSEYMEKHSVSKMIGSPPGYIGYDEGGQLSEQVRRHPYSVILFDEIEKAHPDVFNVLLQVLDDGHITDAQGRRVNFKNTIIVMTSNAGAQEIVEPKKLGFSAGEDEAADYERMKSRVMEEVNRIFKPEFLNRIDETIVFHSLSKEDLQKITGLLCASLTKRCLEQLFLHLDITDDAKKTIVELAYDPKYGARPLKRLIQTRIEDPMADLLISGSVKRGDHVRIGSKDGDLVIHLPEADEE